MKSKGAIKFFAIALAVVCLYQLSFTFVTSVIENRAEEYAQGDPIKKQEYLDSMAHEPVYNLGVKNYTYSECAARKLNLGLDLQGGMHVTLEVSMKDLILELSNNNEDETFRKALKAASEEHQNSDEDFVPLFYQNFQELDEDANLAAIFATRENQDQIDFDASDEAVLDFLNQEASDAVDRTFNILRARVNQFGVSQPNIQKQEGTGRIIIELPGVEDQQRIRNLLQATANLGFWETYESSEIIPYFEDVNEVLTRKLDLADTVTDTAQQEEGADVEEFFGDGEGADTTQQTLNDTSEQEDPQAGEASGDTGLLGEGADTAQGQDTGMSQEEFREENPLYTVMRPAVGQNGAPVPGPVVGYARGRDTSKVNEYLQYEEVRQVLPQDVKFFWTAKSAGNDNNVYQLLATKVTTRDGDPPLTGEVITDAQVDVSERGQRQVAVSMNSRGARVWERLTGDNIGSSIAIVMDGKVYSYPNVNQKISGGNSVISGRFTTQEAQDLANVLESGKLPMVVNIVQEAVVGPSLGEESIQSGLISLLVGMILVLLFMYFYYNHGGLVANFALLANLFFILGVLASLGAALTLPGMAGIVLTIGMSVDANVLIFERIREELRAGKGLNLAIADGYGNAYSSIIDANLTTLLTAIILYTFGSGPIHGFAIILIIGILTSLFSAIFITRLVLDWTLAKDKIVQFSNQYTFSALTNFDFNFIGKRKVAYVLSGVLLGAGIISLATQGLNLGIDFKGGYSYIVRFDESVKSVDVRDALTEPFDGAPQVKTFGPSNQVKIITDYLINETAEGTEKQVTGNLKAGLDKVGGNYEIKSTQKVGPTIAEDIKTSAVWAVLFSLIIIFLYIFLRFRKWQYGLGALAAVFHDVLIIIGIFSLFQHIMPFSLQIDQAFIAAILTVVGYSINDTVVVFDRMREKLNIHKRRPFLETVNSALNETLSRTIVTSFTTLIVILILFIFGGEIIRGFSFALLIGILVGTYSSLFVSSSVVMELGQEEEREPEKK